MDFKEIDKIYKYLHCGSGLLMKSRKNDIKPAPVTMSSRMYPKILYDRAIRLQSIINELFNQISKDYTFILHSHKSLVQNDKFLHFLVQIFQKYFNFEYKKRSRMLILRSDYLIHQDDDKQISLKQVEINTIACAFIGLGSKMNQFHQYIYENVKKLPNYVKTQKNNIMDTIKAFKNIWELEKFFENSEKIYLLVFVSSNELNIFDQFIIESELEKMNIPTIRYSFEELDNYELIENNGYLDLYVDNKRIGLIYFRNGYDPQHFKKDNYYKIYQDLHLNSCVKVPDIGAQLSGSKRVTQLLCDESILFNHLYDAYNDIDRARSDASILKESFMEQYDFMDEEQNKDLYQKIFENPYKYYLKPQREGGNNNYTGESLKQFLMELKSLENFNKKMKSFILMKKIDSPISPFDHIEFDNFKYILEDGISELGVFGTIISNEKEIISNTTGYILRTKPKKATEGGIVAGYSFLDTMILQ